MDTNSYYTRFVSDVNIASRCNFKKFGKSPMTKSIMVILCSSSQEQIIFEKVVSCIENGTMQQLSPMESRIKKVLEAYGKKKLLKFEIHQKSNYVSLVAFAEALVQNYVSQMHISFMGVVVAESVLTTTLELQQNNTQMYSNTWLHLLTMVPCYPLGIPLCRFTDVINLHVQGAIFFVVVNFSLHTELPVVTYETPKYLLELRYANLLIFDANSDLSAEDKLYLEQIKECSAVACHGTTSVSQLRPNTSTRFSKSVMADVLHQLRLIMTETRACRLDNSMFSLCDNVTMMLDIKLDNVIGICACAFVFEFKTREEKKVGCVYILVVCNDQTYLLQMDPDTAAVAGISAPNIISVEAKEILFSKEKYSLLVSMDTASFSASFICAEKQQTVTFEKRTVLTPEPITHCRTQNLHLNVSYFEYADSQYSQKMPPVVEYMNGLEKFRALCTVHPSNQAVAACMIREATLKYTGSIKARMTDYSKHSILDVNPLNNTSDDHEEFPVLSISAIMQRMVPPSFAGTMAVKSVQAQEINAPMITGKNYGSIVMQSLQNRFCIEKTGEDFASILLNHTCNHPETLIAWDKVVSMSSSPYPNASDVYTISVPASYMHERCAIVFGSNIMYNSENNLMKQGLTGTLFEGIIMFIQSERRHALFIMAHIIGSSEVYMIGKCYIELPRATNLYYRVDEQNLLIYVEGTRNCTYNSYNTAPIVIPRFFDSIKHNNLVRLPNFGLYIPAHASEPSEILMPDVIGIGCRDPRRYCSAHRGGLTCLGTRAGENDPGHSSSAYIKYAAAGFVLTNATTMTQVCA